MNKYGIAIKNGTVSRNCYPTNNTNKIVLRFWRLQLSLAYKESNKVNNQLTRHAKHKFSFLFPNDPSSVIPLLTRTGETTHPFSRWERLRWNLCLFSVRTDWLELLALTKDHYMQLARLWLLSFCRKIRRCESVCEDTSKGCSMYEAIKRNHILQFLVMKTRDTLSFLVCWFVTRSSSFFKWLNHTKLVQVLSWLKGDSPFF